MPTRYIIFALMAATVLALVAMYNALVRARNQIDKILGTIDVMLKKRWDLVPNLVAAVKGYADHERTLFDQVARIRSQVGPELTPEQKVHLDNMFTQVLVGLQAVVERYPDLKASENFMHLQRTLTELEEQISAARRAFNAVVTDYNNLVQTFPCNIIAGILQFRTMELFHIEASQSGPPQVGYHEDTTRGTDIHS